MRKILLLIIITLALFLRFYKLGCYPALNADEAAIGYNSYSLIQTGKDEHGNFWPIHFQSFDDYKPGLYFYLVLPFIKILGLNELTVRLPGAFLGVATVYLNYLLVRRLFRDEKLGITASFFLAISPWHIHFSRGAWEVNVATFFVVLGLYLFFKGLKDLTLLMFSAISFSLSLYTYHAVRVIVPLIVLAAIVIYWNEVRMNLKNFLLAGLIGLVAITPLLKDFTRPELSSRAVGVALFADPGHVARINEQRGEHADFQGVIPRLLHNKVINYGLAFLENWAEHFHGEFLFLSGDVIQRNRVPETGQMYLFDIVLFGAGLIFILRVMTKKSDKTNFREWLLILWWLVVAPLAAAFTFQSPHALRSHNMVIPLAIISAYGLSSLLFRFGKRIKSKLVLNIISVFVIIFISSNFARYLHMYWVHMAKDYPFSSQYGVKELTDYIKTNGRSYEKIIVTDRYDQPYTLFLFYMKYPPVSFQGSRELARRDKFGFSTVRAFDKYEFRSIDFDKERLESSGALIVGTAHEIPDEAAIIKEIYGINGYKYFQIVAN